MPPDELLPPVLLLPFMTAAPPLLLIPPVVPPVELEAAPPEPVLVPWAAGPELDPVICVDELQARTKWQAIDDRRARRTVDLQLTSAVWERSVCGERSGGGLNMDCLSALRSVRAKRTVPTTRRALGMNGT